MYVKFSMCIVIYGWQCILIIVYHKYMYIDIFKSFDQKVASLEFNNDVAIYIDAALHHDVA